MKYTRYGKLRIKGKTIEVVLSTPKSKYQQRKRRGKIYEWVDKYIECYIPKRMDAKEFVIIPRHRLEALGIIIEEEQ